MLRAFEVAFGATCGVASAFSVMIILGKLIRLAVGMI